MIPIQCSPPCHCFHFSTFINYDKTNKLIKYFFLFAAFLSAADDVNAEISTTTLSTPLNETTVTKSAEIENLSAENASVEGSKPPRLFPIDDEKIVPKNDTALKILQEISSKSSEVNLIRHARQLFSVSSPSCSLVKKDNSRCKHISCAVNDESLP